MKGFTLKKLTNLLFLLLLALLFASLASCSAPSEFQKKTTLQIGNNARYYCDKITPIIDDSNAPNIEKIVSRKLFEENKITAEKLFSTIRPKNYIFPKPAQKEAINVLEKNAEWFFNNAVRYIYMNDKIPETYKKQLKTHLKNNYELSKSLKESIE